ncbi:MAG: MmgE/PrpD family protein [Betaproteobacteria bacterium]|nr:MmgE/PrpD family protein [Betaproteobacteria bacterium]
MPRSRNTRNAGKSAENASTGQSPSTNPPATFALELARRINALCYDDLPADAVYWARVGILDHVGVTLAGSREEATRIVRELALRGAAGGPAVVFGRDLRVNALDAALVNGTAAHVLDFDDCSNTMGGHPSAGILPALFAAAEESGANGSDFIAAYVAGIEVDCKFSLGVNFYQYNKGWHPTTSIGIFGCAAACAKLLKLSEERTATALAIAASLAAGIKSNFGTMVKPLHVGHCNRSALFAAQLARDGFTASANAFEHHHGYFNVFNGEGNYDASRILAAWAKPLDITRPGITIKLYPCCGSIHPAIEAMAALVREHDLKPESIERVDVWLHTRRLAHTNRPDPRTPLDAKFSVQYCVARAVTDRRITIEQFEGNAHNDPAVRRLLPKIHAATYTTAQFPADHHFGAEVKVTTTGGRVLAQKVHFQLGRTVDIPAPPELLKEKFENCAARALPRERIAEIHAEVQRFEKLSDVRDFTRLLAVDAAKSRRVAAA